VIRNKNKVKIKRTVPFNTFPEWAVIGPMRVASAPSFFLDKRDDMK